MTYTYTVFNSGTEPLHGVTVLDSILGNLTANFKAANMDSDALPVDGSVTFKKDFVIPDDAPARLCNTVDVTALGPAGESVTWSAEACVLTVPLPSDGDFKRCFLPVTFTQQGWHDFCATDICNPEGEIIRGGMIYNRFPRVFANFKFFGEYVHNQLIVGKRHTITFNATSIGLKRLCLFLPQTGPCGGLKRDYVDIWQPTEAGALAGEVVALTMNIAYNDMRLMPRTPGYDLEKFVLAGSILKGRTVGHVLSIADAILGGEPPANFGLSLSACDMQDPCEVLLDILRKINAN